MTCYLWTRIPPDRRSSKYYGPNGETFYELLQADELAATCGEDSWVAFGPCRAHWELAMQAGRRFATVGRIYRSKFRDLLGWNGETYAGLKLIEAFTAGAMAEARYAGKVEGSVEQYADAHPLNL